VSDVYKRVMTGSAVSGGITATGYIIATSMASADGAEGGIEVPSAISTRCIMLIVCFTIIAGGAWLIRRGHRDAAEEKIRPVIREEVDRALTETMPLLVATVVEALDRRVTEHMHEVAVAAGRRTVAGVRDAVTADLTQIAADIHRRAMITGALADRAAAGRSGLRSVPHHYVSTSEGD
jgi:hypothetical protein